MEEQKRVEGLSLSLKNIDWMKDAPFCKCVKRERVLYICLQPHCHQPGYDLYCWPCLESGVHNEKPAIKIQDSMDRFMAIWQLLKDKVESTTRNALTAYRVYEKVIRHLEDCFKP